MWITQKFKHEIRYYIWRRYMYTHAKHARIFHELLHQMREASTLWNKIWAETKVNFLPWVSKLESGVFVVAIFLFI